MIRQVCNWVDSCWMEKYKVIVTRYRKKMHCFRHATDEAISERNSHSEEQKSFFVDYGLTIVKVIHSLLK